MDAIHPQGGKLPCIKIAAAKAPGNTGINGRQLLRFLHTGSGKLNALFTAQRCGRHQHHLRHRRKGVCCAQAKQNFLHAIAYLLCAHMVARFGVVRAQHHHQCVRHMALHNGHNVLDARAVGFDVIRKHRGAAREALGHHLVAFPQQLCHAAGPAHLARIARARAGHIAKRVGISKAKYRFHRAARSFSACAQRHRGKHRRAGQKAAFACPGRPCLRRRCGQSSSAIWFITAAIILMSSM